MKIQNKKTWISIFILITIEQLIKIVINNSFLEKKCPILPPFLYFEPMFNREYSWFNSLLQLGVSKWVHISIVAIMSMLIYLFYQYLNKQLGANKIINIMYAFIFSGAICSLIDKIFWNGSLDYILVNGFFTFDLKDVYINVFIGLLMLSLILDRKVLKQIEDNNILENFIKYILRKS
jgi:signal peptidase II